MNVINISSSVYSYNNLTKNISQQPKSINNKEINKIKDIPAEYDKNQDGQWDIDLEIGYWLHSSENNYSIGCKGYITDEYPKIMVELEDSNGEVYFRDYIDPTNVDLENISLAEAVAYSTYMSKEGKFTGEDFVRFTDLITRDIYPEAYTEGKEYTTEVLKRMPNERFNLRNGLKNALSLMAKQGDLTNYYLYSNLEKLIFKYKNNNFYTQSTNNTNNKISKVPYMLI